jgi:hypothetical protein
VFCNENDYQYSFDGGWGSAVMLNIAEPTLIHEEIK